MRYEISKDRAYLWLTVDLEEQESLQLLQRLEKQRERNEASTGDWRLSDWNPGDSIQSEAIMYDFLEPLVCNSELDWIPEGITGDLTSAPMLGIYGNEEPLSSKYKEWGWNQGTRLSSGRDGQVFVQPVLERWAFLDYMIRSPLQDLANYGKVTFVGGPLR